MVGGHGSDRKKRRSGAVLTPKDPLHTRIKVDERVPRGPAPLGINRQLGYFFS